MDAHKNFAVTTVTVAPSPAASGTSVTVADASVFPATPFNATVCPSDAIPTPSTAEIVRVTNIVGNVLTITRTQEGSSARTITAGDLIAATITAKVITDIETAIPSTAGLLSAVKVSAGTLSSNVSAVTFSNANGVSFGFDGSNVTASVATNYQSQGAYLTTAMASNRGTDFVQATAAFAGTNASGTIASNGISVSVGNYLTTARASTDAIGLNTALTGNGVSVTANSSGLSINVPAFLTTAALSNHSHGNPQLNLTNLSGTTASNSAGFTLSLSAAAGGGGDGYNIIGVNGAGTSLSATLQLSNSNNVSFGLNGSTITASASQSVQTQNVHNVTLSGNTAGVLAAISSGTLTIAGGNNITVSQNGNAITISGANLGGAQTGISGLAAAGGTITSGTASFSNANGVSFGVNGQTITASVSQSNQSAIKGFGVSNTGQTAGNTGISTGVDWVLAGSNSITLSQSTVGGGPNTVWIQHPAWLTTAALSQDSSKYAGTNGAITGGSITVNTSGVSINLPAYLTTADLSQNSSKYVQEWALTGNTAGTTSSAQGTRLYFSGGNNITLSGSSNSIVLSVGNYLTTARASNDAIGLNTAQSNVTWTVNSSGLSLDARGYAGTATGATNASLTVNSGGVSVSVAAPVTTNGLISAVNLSAGTTSSNAAAFTFSNANGVSFGLGTGANAGVLTATVATNYLTTARASNDAIGLNTAQSNVTWTVNSSGLSLDARGYAGTGTSATNASITLNSNGLAISVGAGAQSNQTIGGYATGNTGGQSSSSTFDARSLSFSGVGAVSVGMSGGMILISGGTAAAAPVGVSAGTTSGSLSNIVFSNSNGISFGLNGSTVTGSANTVGTATTVAAVASANSVGTVTRWAAEDHAHAGVGALGLSTAGNSSGTSGSVQGTYWLQGGNNVTISQITSNNGSHTAVFSVGNYLTTAMASNRGTDFVQATAAFAGTGASGTIASNGISVSVIRPTTLSSYEAVPLLGLSTNTVALNAATSGSVSVFPFVIDEYVSAGVMNLLMTANFTTVGTSSGLQTAGIAAGLFTRGAGGNSTRLESLVSTSFSWQVSGNNSSYTINQVTATSYTGYGLTGATNSAGVNISSGYTGGKLVGIPINALLTPGNYWLGIIGTNSTSSNNVGMTLGYLGAVINTLQTALAPIGSYSSAYSLGIDPFGGRWEPGLGVWTSAGSVTNLPASMAFTSISAAAATVMPAMRFWST